MTRTYGDVVRSRRALLGLSQRELSEKAGVKQPLIAAIETGRRQPSESTRTALDAALEFRPSVALSARRDEVRELFTRAGLAAPRVFGSVARGEDNGASDIDLLVAFTDRHDVVDMLTIEDELEELLTVPVDIVDARGDGPAADHARTESVAL